MSIILCQGQLKFRKKRDTGAGVKKFLNFNIQKNKLIVLYDGGRFKFTFDNLPKQDNLAT